MTSPETDFQTEPSFRHDTWLAYDTPEQRQKEPIDYSERILEIVETYAVLSLRLTLVISEDERHQVAFNYLQAEPGKTTLKDLVETWREKNLQISERIVMLKQALAELDSELELIRPHASILEDTTKH